MAKPALRLIGRSIVGGILLIVLGGGLGVAGLLAWERSREAELDARLDALMTFVPPTTVQVQDRHGAPLDSFGVERRIWVPLAEMPAWLPSAVTAAEDRRFWTHGGVDPTGILRAALQNYRAGRITEGGSTLTQQIVKKLVVGDDRTYLRKIEEALLARRLEARRSKAEILELYLNYTYFGSGNYGVEAAAQDYFGVSVREIDEAQACLLAGLIPAPSRYSPRADPQLARSQRKRVLFDLVETGQLSAERAQELSEDPIDPPRRAQVGVVEVGNAYRTAVRRQVRDLFTTADAERLGLKVRTPYDPAVQQVAEVAVRDAAEAVMERNGRVVPVGRIQNLADWDQFRVLGRDLPLGPDGVPKVPGIGDCVVAMMNRPHQALLAGPHKIEMAPSAWWKRVRSSDPEEPSDVLLKAAWGTLFDVCLEADGAHLVERPWVEGAAVVIENSTGGVVALVGGVEMSLEGFDHATQARRQPGSTFKPFVYGTALERGRTQLDEVLDSPLSVGGWTPRNANGQYFGAIPMRKALTYSLNTVAVRLLMESGVDQVRDFAARAGIRAPLRDDLTIALGTSEVAVMDQAVGYATLARGGLHTEPVFLAEVRDLHESLLGRAGDPLDLEGVERLPGPDGTQVIDSAVAAQLVDMLAQVVREGTGRRAFDPHHARAGKTGTTNHAVDTWFAGMIPTHTVVVWIGSDERVSLGKWESGSRAALPAWVQIVEALEPTSDTAFPVPPSVKLVSFEGQMARLPRVVDPGASLPDELPGFPTGVDPARLRRDRERTEALTPPQEIIR